MPRRALTEEEQHFFGTKSRAKPPQPSAAFAGRPRMPGYLSGEAKQKWRELIRYLSQRGILTPGDGLLLEQYCVIYQRWRQLVDEVTCDGPIVNVAVTDNDGLTNTVRKESAASKAAGRLEIQLRALLKELTLTVASREHAKPAKERPAKESEPATPPATVGEALRGHHD